MSFTEKNNAISKQPVKLVILILDYCANYFQLTPCKAAGDPCYNTFKTCKDKVNYIKTTKAYRYCSNDSDAAAILNALPYIKAIDPMSTELRDDKTICARGTITLMDENDYDQTTDPYWKQRRGNLLNASGTHFKKLIERNPYYKSRAVIVKDGYVGDPESEFVTTIKAKIENITRDGSEIKIEYVDEVSDLSKKDYPYITNVKIAEDLGACFDCKNEEEMLKAEAVKNDYALRRDFRQIKPNVTGASTEIPTSSNYFLVVAYNEIGMPFAMSNVTEVNADYPGPSITIYWDAVSNASYYRVFGIDGYFLKYTQLTGTSFVHYEGQQLETDGELPGEAYRVFKLQGDEAANLQNWNEIFTFPVIQLDSTEELDPNGYIQINEEAFYYTSLNSTSKTIAGIRRIEFKTKSQIHYAGTNLKLLEWETPSNGFSLLKKRFQRSGVPDENIDITTIDAYAAAYTGINMSTLPIIKSTNAAKLIFDLAWVLDVKLWVNEEGKLTVKPNDDETIQYYIDDAVNIVLDSKSIDYNQDDIRTRFNLNWNRKDVTKGLEDEDNYANLHIEFDRDAEGENMYGKVLKEDVFTTWINSDCGTETEINAYIHTLCNKKLNRSREPRPKLTFEVEQKDSGVKVGYIVSLSSNAFNDINGNDYQNKKAEVIKKTPKWGRIELTVRLLPTETITSEYEDHIYWFENPEPVRSVSLTEVEVTGLSYIDDLGNRVYDLPMEKFSGVWIGYGEIEHSITLACDNMYTSEAETATDINGVTRQLEKRMIYTGFPPAPHHIETNLESWKSGKYYNIYMIVLNADKKKSSLGRPSASDPDGQWFRIGKKPVERVNDASKFYKFNYALPNELLGREVGFVIYYDCNLVYDPNSPVGIAIEKSI